MSKGTIIYIGGFELPDKNAAAHRVLNNGKALREIGYNVVFLGIDKSLNYTNSVVTTFKKVQNFDSWYIPYPNTKKQWFNYLSSIESFIEIYKKYDDVKAVICYNFQSISFLKIFKFLKKEKIELYSDCTEWYGAQGQNIFKKLLKGTDSFIRMRIIHRKINGLIVISEYLNNFYAKKNKVIIIPPLVDLSESKWETVKIKKLRNHRTRLVYSGSPGNKDKINIIVRSLYLLKNEFDYSFSIIGIDKENYLKYYPEDQLIINGLSNKIKFLGRISHQESLNNIIDSDFSIFVREDNLISRAGFPTKFVESISCGTPVITNSNSNITDYLVEGENGFLINTQSVEKVSECLTEILLKLRTDSTMKKEYKNEFDYRNFVENFKQIF